eukprot:CAMPEP_0174877238 /NCGR_PEP_ID=MMETSP1114-20130205/81557_1 /TAXON_ID=312471 /ORGANISM="Neobodo designis, Strain CCAP 1951/1" /LENGTH=54 /DNA_ID=CAMNT_0016112615 /DNA_START=150 /DNA_END=311 /DNA_ORIENTATION=-
MMLGVCNVDKREVHAAQARFKLGQQQLPSNVSTFRQRPPDTRRNLAGDSGRVIH